MRAHLRIAGKALAAGTIPTTLWLVAIQAVGGTVPDDLGSMFGVAVMLWPAATVGTGLCAAIGVVAIIGVGDTIATRGEHIQILGVALAIGLIVACIAAVIGLAVAATVSPFLGLGLELGDAFGPAIAAGVVIDVALGGALLAAILLQSEMAGRAR
ncbi:MAG: hypothetical protein AB1736_04770 [Chloroflexota bacterium]